MTVPAASLIVPCRNEKDSIEPCIQSLLAQDLPGESFLSFFAFQEGMLDTQILALGGWPTVTGSFWRQQGGAKHDA